MFRIDHPTAVGALPAAGAPGAPGYFSAATPGAGVPTVVTNDWANGIQEELMSILAAGGIAPDKDAYNQVLLAIQSIIGGTAVVGAGAIHGMRLSPTPGNETTRITITAGLCRDSSNTAGGVSGVAMSKKLDAAWAPGDGNGGRLSGALVNAGTWHVFALINPLTGAVEFGFDASPTAPDLAGSGAAGAGYTKFRRLGAVVLEAASTAIRPFYQIGDWFYYKLRSTDYAVQSNGGGVAAYRTWALPIGIEGRCEVHYQSTGTPNTTAYWSGLFAPQFGVPPAFGSPTQRATIRRIAAYQQAAGADLSYGTVDNAIVMFDTTGHIYTFSSDNAGDVIAGGIKGWEDLRGRFY